MTTPPSGTSFPSGTINPYQNDSELALINITAVIAALLPSTLLDEDGHPLAVNVRAIDSDDPITAPEVVVDLAEGESRQTYGDNLLSYDSATNMWLRGQEFENTRITITVRGRNDAERRFLVTAIRNGLRAGYGVLAAGPGTPTGAQIEAIAMVALRQVGFSRFRYDATTYPSPSQDEARPEGLVFPAHLTLRCSLWMTWETPGALAPVGTATTTIGY